MNERPLPSEGKDRQIFLQALRHYSDTCEAPSLHPDCPFAEPFPGGRVCAEQCMDLLAEHGPAQRPGAVSLGPGLSAYKRRPRARRMPAVPPKPFDSSEMYLEDVDKEDLATWRMSSLISELINKLTTPPPNDDQARVDRLTRIRVLLDEIGLRGIDSKGLVRFGLGPHFLSAGIVFSASIPDAMPADIAERMMDMAAPPEWTEWLREMVDASPRTPTRSSRNTSSAYLGRAFQAAVPKVISWIETAPLDDVLTWNLASLDGSEAPFQPTTEQHVTHGWLVDRFYRTYMTDWRTESLLAEYEYVHAERASPCARTDMKIRTVDRDELARLIADRTVRDRAAEVRNPHHKAVTRYTTVAAQWLKEGDRAKAAAIFDAFREMDPTSGEAHNNYGFCLLPDDPDGALAALQQAAGLDKPEMINAGNRVLALGLLGRDALALEVAERALVEYEVTQPPVWAWDPELLDEKQATLNQNVDVHEYIVALGLKIAQRTGDPVLIARWENRLGGESDSLSN